MWGSTKTMRIKWGIWKSIYPWRKEWVFPERKKKEKKKNQFTHFEVFFFNSQNKIKKKNPKNEEGKSKYMYGELLRKHLVFENKRC